MSFFKSLLKWTLYKFMSLLILTVILVIMYVVQMSYFNLFVKPKSSTTEEVDTELLNEDYSFPTNINRTEFEGEKLVHFDLKGAPPKISYLLNFLPFIKKLGASGILMEYEDTFPYHSGLEDIRALNAYTLPDIAAIVETARKYNLTVIPLIPTFSHFEFVLKLEKYKRFREVEKNPQVLCPSEKDIYPVLYKMIDQVLEAHKTSSYLHIGCDEAAYIGICPKCRKLVKKKKLRKSDIYFRHVKKIAEYITINHPHIKPIMWSDEFSKQNEKVILRYQIPDLVEVMFWNYNIDKYSFPNRDNMKSYAKMFKTIWIANAFKGATGSTQIITNIDHHLKNTIGWMKFVEQWRAKLQFKGITLTGWQRYNHFLLLCELLPVGIPSLALNLQYINNIHGLNYYEVQNSLGCNDFVPINLQEIEDLNLLSRLQCEFPGFQIYRLTHYFYNTLNRVRPALNKLQKGDLAFYSTIHNESNPEYIQRLLKENYTQYLNEVDYLESELKVALAEVYDQYTVNEWIMTHVMPVRIRLEAAINMIKTLGGMKAWPRRPQQSDSLKVEKLFDKICGNNETRGCTFFNIRVR